MHSLNRLPEKRCCFISPRDKLILEKIIAFCQRIAQHVKRIDHDYAAFENDTLFQDACCMCIVQIGELAGQLSDAVKKQNASIPWRIIKDTRNFYVHAYGSIDLPSVWETINSEIPSLQNACECILENKS